MDCYDGGVRHIYPVLTAYIADFPEQCKVACTKTTHCPTCTVKPTKRGDLGHEPVCTCKAVIAAMDKYRKGSAEFERLGLFRIDIEPFWRKHQYTDIGCLLTPNLLHQLHKGVLKDHLTKWAMHIIGKQTVDERHKTMPEYCGMRHFKNGISAVSQWTGRELKEMAKVLLPIIANSDKEMIIAARAILDFVYLVHSSSLLDHELHKMENALRVFHEHKHIFKQYGAVATKKGFHGIPKIHMICHYVHIIHKLGTPDGYNTETLERLHIDFAKMGYRVLNKVNATKQMALYIQRLEALAMHASYLKEEAQESGNRQDTSETNANAEDPIAYDKNKEQWDKWYDEEEIAEDSAYGTDDEDEDTQEADKPAQGADKQAHSSTRLDDKGSKETPVGRWEKEQPRGADDPQNLHPRFHPIPEIVLAKTPTTTGVKIGQVAELNFAPRLTHDLTLFLHRENPNHGSIQSHTAINNLPHRSVAVSVTSST